MTTDSIFISTFIFGLLFWLIPIAFILWFTITTTKQLKMQTQLLQEIKERIDRQHMK